VVGVSIIRSRYFQVGVFYHTLYMYDIKKVSDFLHAFYICIILKYVGVCIGVVLCSEVGNVTLHALTAPGAAGG